MTDAEVAQIRAWADEYRRVRNNKNHGDLLAQINAIENERERK